MPRRGQLTFDSQAIVEFKFARVKAGAVFTCQKLGLYLFYLSAEDPLLYALFSLFCFRHTHAPALLFATTRAFFIGAPSPGFTDKNT